MNTNQPPTVNVLTDTSHRVRDVVVGCPYCGHRHRHRVPLKASGEMTRVSHCKHNRRRYVITWSEVSD